MCNNFQQIVCGRALAKIFTHSPVRNRSGAGNYGALIKPRRSKKPFLQLLATVTLACCGHVADARTALPDVPPGFCPISQDVVPPDNLDASLSNDCAFLERAEKMFLWVTSSPSAKDSYVFRSSAFFDAWSTDSVLRELKPADAKPTNSTLKNLDVRVAIEPGEVDRKVLVTQDCRLVYYLIQVNDVYAYFLTGYKNGTIQATEFPTGEADLAMIEAQAGKRLVDRNALAVQLKSSWIEFTESEAANYITNYITIKRTIPTYNNPVPCSSTATSTSWSPTGSREAQLALIGMHVVFSANGHPEMLWGTFEHVNNTPNEAYKYFDRNGNQQSQKSDVADSHWMFSDSDPTATFNSTSMHLDQGGNIVADGSKLIGPSNILRNAPWGRSPDMPDLNTKIISINKQLVGGLADTDARKNYIMIGTSWTFNGADPRTVAWRRGSDRLVNSTMETFHNQGSSTCFECHQGPTMLGDHCQRTGLSHLFGVLQPLSGGDSQGQCTSVQ